MSRATYTIGDLVRLSAAFAVGGVATDPTAPTVKVKKPDETLTTATPTRDSAGNYHYDVACDQSGTYYYGASGTGAATAAAEGEFYVEPSNLT